MSNLFLFTFLVSIVSLVVLLKKSTIETKKFALAAIVGIILSFSLFNGAIYKENMNFEKELKAAQITEQEVTEKLTGVQEAKQITEKKLKEEQEAKQNVEKILKAEQEAKQNTEKKLKEEQEAKQNLEKKLKEAEEAQRSAEQNAKEARENSQNLEATQSANYNSNANTNQSSNSNSGITGYCKDGTVATGDPSARGKANSCYGHGGWVR